LKDKPSGRQTGKNPTVSGIRPNREPTRGADLEPIDALNLSNLGVDLFEKGLFQKAAEAFDKARQIVPDFPGFAANFAGALIAQSRLDEAIQTLEHTRRRREADPSLLVNLGVAWGEKGEQGQEVHLYETALALDQSHREARLDLAIACLESAQAERGLQEAQKLVVQEPTWSEAHFVLGYALGQSRRFEEEIAEYRKVLELDFEHGNALNNLGAVLRQTRQFGQAAEAFSRLAALRAKDPQPRVDEAICRWLAGEHPVAISTVEKALEIQPGYLPALTTLGLLLTNLGENEKARECATRAISLYPKAAEAHVVLGLIEELQNNHDHALAAYDRSLDLSPRWVAVMLHRAGVLTLLGHHREAAAGYRQALAIDPELSLARVELAESLIIEGEKDEARALLLTLSQNSCEPFVLRKMGKLLTELDLQDRAIEVFERLLELDPRDDASVQALGQIHAKRREYDRAVACFEKAFRLNPNHAKASYNLAMIHYTRGHHELARKVLDLTVKVEPTNVRAWNLLGKSHLKLGQPRQALEAFEEAHRLRPESTSIVVKLVKVASELGDGERVTRYYALAKALKKKRDRMKSLPVGGNEDEDEPA